jgi:7-cyano-7-deazaguanine tRNA-ribosyltransferase
LLIVAGFTLKCIEPRVWDKTSPYYLPDLKAVMISYAEIHEMPRVRERMMRDGIHANLGIPSDVKVFLDNGAFGLSRKGLEIEAADYEKFVAAAKPDWRPVPQDFIPAPAMTDDEQQICLQRTMKVNTDFQHDGFVPVVHISRVIDKYISEIKVNEKLVAKPRLAIGGIVPNLLRAPKAIPHQQILETLIKLREEFADKEIHVFGIGGISTLHVAALLGIDSVDSSGWRNRAARGIIILPGKSERIIAQLGSWRGRSVSEEEKEILLNCQCPVCQKFGLEGLTAKASEGFRNRATHNLWTLLEEAKWISEKLKTDEYQNEYQARLEGSTYRKLVNYLVARKIDKV